MGVRFKNANLDWTPSLCHLGVLVLLSYLTVTLEKCPPTTLQRLFWSCCQASFFLWANRCILHSCFKQLFCFHQRNGVLTDFLFGYLADLSLMMRRYICRTNAVVLQIWEVSSFNWCNSIIFIRDNWFKCWCLSDYVCVLDLGMFELSLFTCDGSEQVRRPKNRTESVDVFHVNVFFH